MIEINDVVKFGTDKKIFSTVAKKVLSGENRERENLSLAFVSRDEIRKLNNKFRKKNKPTDVLSFELKEKNLLGEIVICPEVAKENAEKYGVSLREEVLKLFVHGILHLCGYDHEKEKDAKKMELKEKFYLNEG